MNFSTTYEKPLRSYIQNRVEILENTLEEVVNNRSNIEVDQLEQQIDRETNSFITDVTRRLHQTRDEIKAHRPTDHQAPDYEIRLNQYRQFVESSSTGVNQATQWIHSMFEKIISIVKSIVQWINDNAQTILKIIEQIRDAFKLLSSLFFRY
ncbi:unnamed protein product [Rotaria magnacalcarata]|uniref:Uncharacterized protein n=1 Tax=Rotaria magnacalcarata TaxID=392030 RepID=A0A816S614_9BILA|nr:unnamed protein product [Rotaria magnacalcarata]CAF1547632.1 unnamed protein product [Rotaria magnacalcarata]CAF2084107.1 unnamed protein product [Rotaria magnacalcarata]CAF2134436.1 unnamed protein product [Rotaria magnacalcarata]CAF3920258.1 unnamed protein product [Rotaria magnacalcarata]